MPPVPAPEPENERARLAALRAYAILDTEPEEGFDDLTRLAAYVCGAPISTVTLVDEDRQWFKSRVGMPDQEGPREWSFCAYAVASGRTFVVPDAQADDRFRDNPYVTGEPGIRFYAGAPLTTSEGLTLGALCVIDREPRELTHEQLEALHLLAKQALAQIELGRRNRELEARDRARETFIASLSHELRTPLTAIRGWVETLADGEAGPVNEEQLSFLKIVDRNADRLLGLVGDLLFIAQANAGLLELEPKEIDVMDLLRDTVEHVRPAAARKGIEVGLEGEPLVLRGDPQRLGQLFDNLAANAVKYTPDGGRVSIETGRRDGQALIGFADTGIGIPAADRITLFGEFTRASNAANLPGTGLGLAISKRIADAHGGSIDVQSEVGEGSTFTVRLPL